jgi:hypothetical protein
MQNKIFSFDSAKAIKAIEFGYYNAIHYMAPHSLSGKNLCSHASPECIAHCLGWHSGQAAMVKHERDINSVRQSRIDKAQRFMNDRKAYLRDVIKSIENGIKASNKKGLKLCVRLNGSTDIAWEGIACQHNGVIYKNIMAILIYNLHFLMFLLVRKITIKNQILIISIINLASLVNFF